MTELTTAVHHALTRSLLDVGRARSNTEIAADLAVPIERVRVSLDELARTHGLVLHPHSHDPWIVHPFSVSPSATWVERADGTGWWAPCILCACGIAALAADDVTIHTRFGGEAEDVDIHIVAGKVVEDQLFVHFAVPPKTAWDNVHHFCATVLPFRSSDDVTAWSERHAIPVGSVVPVPQVMDLGREWYSSYADPDWRKWSVREAAAVFEKVGLSGPFWALPDRDGGY